MFLIFIWVIMIFLIIMMYVLLDGFDLGVGILFFWIKLSEYSDIMMSIVVFVWDGNEIWLVFGVVVFYVVFLMVYGILLFILYMLMMILLVVLIFCGVVFEFCFKVYKS